MHYTRVVVHVGTNNLERLGGRETAKQLQELREELALAFPTKTFFLSAVIPRKDHLQEEAFICSRLTSKHGGFFAKALLSKGKVKGGMLKRDKLHLTLEGAMAFAKSLDGWLASLPH